MKPKLIPHYLSDLQVGDLLVVKHPDSRIKRNELVIFTKRVDDTYTFHKVKEGGEWTIKSADNDYYSAHWLVNVLEKIG